MLGEVKDGTLIGNAEEMSDSWDRGIPWGQCKLENVQHQNRSRNITPSRQVGLIVAKCEYQSQKPKFQV